MVELIIKSGKEEIEHISDLENYTAFASFKVGQDDMCYSFSDQSEIFGAGQTFYKVHSQYTERYDFYDIAVYDLEPDIWINSHYGSEEIREDWTLYKLERKTWNEKEVTLIEVSDETQTDIVDLINRYNGAPCSNLREHIFETALEDSYSQVRSHCRMVHLPADRLDEHPQLFVLGNTEEEN